MISVSVEKQEHSAPILEKCHSSYISADSLFSFVHSQWQITAILWPMAAAPHAQDMGILIELCILPQLLELG